MCCMNDFTSKVSPSKAYSVGNIIAGFVGGGVTIALVWVAFNYLYHPQVQSSLLQTAELLKTHPDSDIKDGLPSLPIVVSTKQMVNVDTFLSEKEIKSLVKDHKNDPGFFSSGTFDRYTPDYLQKNDADNLFVVIPRCVTFTGETEGPGASTQSCQNDVYLKVSNVPEKAFAKIYSFNAVLNEVSYASIKANSNVFDSNPEDTPSFVLTFILNNGYEQCCSADRYLDSWLISYSSSDHITTVYRLDPMDMVSRGNASYFTH